MTLFQFEKLEVWKKSRGLVSKVYTLTRQFPDEEKYALSRQLTRAIVSVPSNIAEGTSRFSSKDQLRFYEIAYGSLLEAFNQLILAADLGFITQDDVNDLRLEFQDISIMLSRLRQYHASKNDKN